MRKWPIVLSLALAGIVGALFYAAHDLTQPAPVTVGPPLIVWPAAVLIRVWPSELRPIERVSQLKAPLLVIGGVIDKHTPIADTRAIFATAREPKELWEIADAGHYDFERHAPDAYRTRVLAFLAKHLGQGW